MTRVLTPLDLEYIDGDNWWLKLAFACETEALGRVDVRAGFITDFNSTPRLLWTVLPPTEAGEAAVPHDELYRSGRCQGRPIQRAEADAVYRELVQWIGSPADMRIMPDGRRRQPVPGWKRRALYWGIRLGGWVPWRKYRQAQAQRT